MRIQHIEVRKLFGVFDHAIPLNIDDRITIVYGPNGFGKTYTLSLVDELFNPGFGNFFRVPFERVAVTLDDGNVVSVEKRPDNGGDILEISLDTPSGRTGKFMFRDHEEKHAKEPSWLTELKASVNVSFIHTERLVNIADSEWRRINQEILSHSNAGDQRVDLLAAIINGRFAHKTMRVDQERGIVVETSYGVELTPSQLSSGEQHVVLLFYRLLFDIEPDTLVLIDEPELSLHIFWQQEFLRDLGDILGRTPADILIATHSPQIIHDRWDLTVELRGPHS